MSSHGVPRTERDRSPEQLKKDLDKIDKYRVLDSQLRAQTSESRLDSTTLELTTKLLRINPEYYTVWNTRRRCLVSGPLRRDDKRPSSKDAPEAHDTGDAPANAPPSLPTSESEPTRRRLATSQGRTEKDGEQDGSGGGSTGVVSKVIRDELIFTVPLLMAHPKCYWIWNYRMWTLEQATSLLPAEMAQSIWQEELRLVAKMLERDRRNYHAWAYRRYVVSHLESAKLQGQSMVETEFAYTTKMIERDLSNFSAWHNRAQLIPRLLVEREANDTSRRAFLDQEFSTVDDGLNVGPDDQSLWYYHQYLILNVTELPENLAIVPDMLVEDQVKVLSREIDFIKDLLEDYKDVKWIFEMLLEYTLLLHKLRNQPVSSEQKGELEAWVSSIKKLDPQRSNRWKELADELEIPQ